MRPRVDALLLAALGALAACTPGTDERPPHASRGRTIDTAALMDTVRTLAAPDMAGRRTGTPGGEKARDWVRARFARIGLPPAGPDYLLPFRVTSRAGETLEGANVAAICEGAAHRGRTIVVSAHYDHLGVHDGQTYHGADDNASGLAVLLDLARLCREQPFQHTMVFVAFDAEEQGLKGARAFVGSPPVPRDGVALNVNLDMVARGDRGELYAAGTYHYPALKPPLEEVAAKAPITLLLGHDRPGTGQDDWTLLSDHGPFHEADIPFVYFGVEDHPDYHKPTDTPEKIDAAFFGGAAATILDAIAALDQRLGN
ncbi:MAG: M28 family peptidase [Vicinamibacterales bacterium]